MNIYQKRHSVLARHKGQRITPAQLKAEVLQTFPDTNPSSINPADCFHTAGKAAGCTCGECTKLGGFAVNNQGIVDMGASGWNGISSIYTPTGNVLENSRSTAAGLITPNAPISQISSRIATKCVQQYNASSYRGRSNIMLDREAYDLFKDGLSRNAGRCEDQIAFVGEQYGGAQERFGSIRKEAALIASNIYPILDRWLQIVGHAKPLVQAVPDQTILDFLFSPFVGTKQWPVWASKTLHFLRPEVFPILDSQAKKPLGLKNLANSSRGYRQFCFAFRNILLANSGALTSARVADAGESPSDIKLLDKILFQLGVAMD
jgi:hypothetical protein